MQKIKLTNHAKTRMQQRQVDIFTLLDILEYGKKEQESENKLKITCGQYIVIVATENNNTLKIITVHFISKITNIIRKIAKRHKVNIHRATEIYLQQTG